MPKYMPWIVAGILGFVILGAGAYYYQATNSSKKTGKTATDSSSKKQDSAKKSDETTGNQASSEKNTIKSLLGKNSECKVSYDGVNGTFFVAGKKLRGDLDVKQEGKTYKTYVIQDEQFAYTWSADSNQGAKISLSDQETQETKSGVDFDKEATVTCKNWAVDNSKFTPPAGVTFVDFTSLSQPGATVDPYEIIRQQQKAACETLEPAAKETCLNAINNQQ